MFDQSLIAQIKETLVSSNKTIAVAESVTSGFFQAALSGAEEATRFYQGGLTAYNLGQKARHLDIDPVHALGCNCVSEKMAEDMARSICKKFTSDWGVGITGYATPVPESGNEQFAYYAICINDTIIRKGKIDNPPGEPVAAQIYYVNKILEQLVNALQETFIKS